MTVETVEMEMFHPPRTPRSKKIKGVVVDDPIPASSKVRGVRIFHSPLPVVSVRTNKDLGM